MSMPSTSHKVTFTSDDRPRLQRATMPSSLTSNDHLMFRKSYRTPVSEPSTSVSPKSSSYSSDNKSTRNKGFASSPDVENDKFQMSVEAEYFPSVPAAYSHSRGPHKEETNTSIYSGRSQRPELAIWSPASAQPKQKMSVPCTSRNVPDRHRVLAIWETIQTKPPA